MKILAIETSCDETAISIIDARGTFPDSTITVLSNIIHSQVKLHEKYGGVFPSLAKREHGKNLIPVLKNALTKSSKVSSGVQPRKELSAVLFTQLEKILEREPELLKQFLDFIKLAEKPDVDAIAVTHGPGLEPALWVGINFAKALGVMWSLPIIPINHMEGHLFSALLQAEKRISKQSQNIEYKIQNITFPVLALLISGGHTELVLMRDWFEYEIVGETRDDAVGEAFDKVARMLHLAYPGGPSIAAEAAQFQILNLKNQNGLEIKLPRPMIHSGDFNFSFSGLKTAVLYQLKKTHELTTGLTREFAYEFQEAATDVLATKTVQAAMRYNIKTILVGGGVSANERIREELQKRVEKHLPSATLYLSPKKLTGDNALMIAIAGHARNSLRPTQHNSRDIKADGSVRLKKQV